MQEFLVALNASFTSTIEKGLDGGHEQTSDRELHFGQGVWNGAENQGRGDAVATSSGLQKPKKVWAKKKFVDTKADKAKKIASSKFK